MSSGVSDVVVVSDSGPLISLGNIERLDLLPSLFSRVVVPRAVWREVVENNPSLPGALAVRAVDFIDVVDIDQLDAAVEGLDIGEAEAITFARHLDHSMLLIDDGAGRRRARQLDLQFIGTIGIVGRAKLAGLIPQARPLLELLDAKGFRIRPSILQAALRDLGE
jgi:hypothetical protein